MEKRIYSLPISEIEAQEIYDSDFIKVKLYAIQDKENRNKSEFLYESFDYGINTIYNKPILAYFNKNINDTEEHNAKLQIDDFGEVFYDYDYDTAEKPVGVIPESADIYVEEKDGKHWIVIDSGLIWTEYNKRLSDLIKRQLKKKVSVEVEALESFKTDDGVERISKWKFLGITILGKDENGIDYEEGIEGAHLVLKGEEFEKRFKKFVNRMNYSINKNPIISKYMSDMGTGDSITVDTSKESVSNDSWGNVDKSKLRETVLKAKNYKSLVKKVYLDVQAGWEDAPSEKLKYPVMQYKDSKLVYNANALLSAQQYGEQHDKSVAQKAKSIRKKLGLTKSEKEENMEEFIKDGANSGYAFLGFYGTSMRFVKIEDACDDKTIKEKMEVFEVSCDDVNKFIEDEAEDKKFAWDEMTGKEVRMAEDEPDKKDDDDEDDDDDDEKKQMMEQFEADKQKFEEEKQKFEADKQEFEANRDEINNRCEALEKELKEMKDEKFKKETDAVLDEANEDIDEKDRQEMVAMRDEGKFASVEDFKREIGYRAYSRQRSNRKKLDYGIDKKIDNTDKEIGSFDRISKI